VYDTHRKQNAWRLAVVEGAGIATAGIEVPTAGIASADTRTNESQNEASAGIAGICGYQIDPSRARETRNTPVITCDAHARESPLRGGLIPADTRMPASPVIPDTCDAGIPGGAETDTRNSSASVGAGDRDRLVDRLRSAEAVAAKTAETIGVYRRHHFSHRELSALLPGQRAAVEAARAALQAFDAEHASAATACRQEPAGLGTERAEGSSSASISAAADDVDGNQGRPSDPGSTWNAEAEALLAAV
jgi:hypothetical protein